MHLEYVNMQFLHLNSYSSLLNTSVTLNCLLIIEITGDLNRIKWQVIKFSLWSRGKTQVTPLRLHRPLLVSHSLPQAAYILLQWNIWHSEQATDLDRNPGISRATAVYGCWGICQSATFQSKACLLKIASMCSVETVTWLPQDEVGRSCCILQ